MAEPLHYDDDLLRGILADTRSIAMVGISAVWNRPSNFAMKYLQAKGYRVVPVNPRVAGSEVLGEPAYATLSDVPGRFDMVDIFRRAEDVGPIVDEAIALKDDKGISVIWMQLGVRNEEAAEKAEAAGFTVIMDRCAKIEFGRLNTELSWGGFDSGVITSKRRRVRLA